MSNEHLIISLLFVHFVADFMAQTDWMAQNKSKNPLALFSHAVVYGLFTLILVGIFLCGGRTVNDAEMLVFYVIVNTISHFCIDMITSQCTSYLWKKQDVHNFFVVVGGDQWLHTSIIILTYKWLLL